MRTKAPTVLVSLALLFFTSQLPAQSSYTLSGTVFGGGSPLANAVVEALQDGTTNVIAQTTTSGAGQYNVLLPPATYDLRVTPPAGSGFGQETIQNVQVAGNRTFDIILLSSQHAVVSGTVRGLGGAAVTSGNVRAYGSSGFLGSTNLDADGRYSLPVTPGTIYLEASGGPSAVAPNWSFNRSNIAVNGPTEVNIDLPVVRVSGAVTDSNGTPVPGVSVAGSAYRSDASGNISSGANALSDALGSYTILLITGSGNFTFTPGAQTGFTHKIRIGERQRDAQPAAVRFAHVPHLLGQELAGALALLPELHVLRGRECQ